MFVLGFIARWKLFAEGHVSVHQPVPAGFTWKLFCGQDTAWGLDVRAGGTGLAIPWFQNKSKYLCVCQVPCVRTTSENLRALKSDGKWCGNRNTCLNFTCKLSSHGSLAHFSTASFISQFDFHINTGLTAVKLWTLVVNIFYENYILGTGCRMEALCYVWSLIPSAVFWLWRSHSHKREAITFDSREPNSPRLRFKGIIVCLHLTVASL